MEEKYVIIQWPDSQLILGEKNIHLIDQEKYPEYGSSAYLIPESLFIARFGWHEEEE